MRAPCWPWWWCISSCATGVSTIVAASALPLSIIPTFLGVYLFGYSLNVITLLSLSLVIGVLVDDAIVEIEEHCSPPGNGQNALSGRHGGR